MTSHSQIYKKIAHWNNYWKLLVEPEISKFILSVPHKVSQLHAKFHKFWMYILGVINFPSGIPCSHLKISAILIFAKYQIRETNQKILL